MRNDDDDEDFIPKEFQNPYDRLNELEAITQGMGSALEEACDQLRSHSTHFAQVSEALMQMARAFERLKLENSSLQQQAQNLHHRVTILEKKEEQ